MNGSMASPVSKSRIEALSDGVFAIAMIFLMFPYRLATRRRGRATRARAAGEAPA